MIVDEIRILQSQYLNSQVIDNGYSLATTNCSSKIGRDKENTTIIVYDEVLDTISIQQI